MTIQDINFHTYLAKYFVFEGRSKLDREKVNTTSSINTTRFKPSDINQTVISWFHELGNADVTFSLSAVLRIKIIFTTLKRGN